MRSQFPPLLFYFFNKLIYSRLRDIEKDTLVHRIKMSHRHDGGDVELPFRIATHIDLCGVKFEYDASRAYPQRIHFCRSLCSLYILASSLRTSQIYERISLHHFIISCMMRCHGKND